MTKEQKMILDLLIQGCITTEIKDWGLEIDNECMSAYEDACAYLQEIGILEEVNQRIYRYKDWKFQPIPPPLS